MRKWKPGRDLYDEISGQGCTLDEISQTWMAMLR
jgi:hypothetical protein